MAKYETYSYEKMKSMPIRTGTKMVNGRLRGYVEPNYIHKYLEDGYRIPYRRESRYEVYYLSAIGNKADIMTHANKFNKIETWRVITTKYKQRNVNSYIYAAHKRKIDRISVNRKGEPYVSEFIGKGKRMWTVNYLQSQKKSTSFRKFGGKEFKSDRIFLYRKEAESYQRKMSKITGYKGYFVAGLYYKKGGCECGGCRGPKTFRVYFPGDN